MGSARDLRAVIVRVRQSGAEKKKPTKNRRRSRNDAGTSRGDE